MHYPNLIYIVFLTCINFQNSVGHLAQIAARLPLKGTPAKPASPWPMPESHSMDSRVASITSRDLRFFIQGNTNCDLLTSAISRYNADLLFRDIDVKSNINTPGLSEVEIVIPESAEENLCREFPKLNTDEDRNYERYTINISAPTASEANAIITANTVWGALRGIETFAQLIWKDDKEDIFYINLTQISDAPRYPHRGLMIDTARHYVDLPVIETVLDAMSYNKLNVLHWHMVDDQSFAFVSTTFPELSQKGAYLPELTYEPEEVQGVINYAKNRGIRVIIEFDTPGHTQGFGKAFPELLTPCYGDGTNPGTPNYTNHAAYEILDPTKETTYDFMRRFFTELKSVSMDEYIHLGMDEVYYSCWMSSPEIRAFMDANNFTEYFEVQKYYTIRHLQMIKETGFKSIIWHDPIEFGVLPEKDVIIQVWKGGDPGLPLDAWVPYFQRVLEKGYQTILSSCWYINYIAYGESWRKYYECDPVESLPNITDEEKKLILGGEAAVFGEYADSTNLVQRIFPFVGAVAERLWSPQFPIDTNLTDNAMHRLDQHRCRMLWRGIAAQPIFNGYCFAQEKTIRRKNNTD